MLPSKLRRPRSAEKTYWDTCSEGGIKLDQQCNVRSTVKLVAGGSHINTYRSLSIADAAWVLANVCSVALSQEAYVLFDELGLGLRRRSLRGWPQKSCPSRRRSLTLRVTLDGSRCSSSKCFVTVSEVSDELWVSRQGAVSKDGVRQGVAPSDVIIPMM